MGEQNAPQNTLRDELTAQIESVEQAQQEPAAQPAQEASDGRVRDEAGRFAKKDEPAPAKPVQQASPPVAPEQQPQEPKRPSTWKKEYWPIADKLAAGQPLTADEAKKFYAYMGQREDEYKAGVSTYKTEAQQAKEVQEAIAPYMPKLQQYGIAPAQWIKSLGEANSILEGGSPQQKLGLVMQLAQRYNIPLAAAFQGGMGAPQQPNPVMDLAAQVDMLRQQTQQFNQWRTQQEQGALQSEIQKVATDTERYPHFEAVRETMAQLLERGVAQDLQSAYDKAVRLDDSVWEQVQSAKLAQQSQAQVVKKAKAAAVSPRSATPSGSAASAGAKDRRSHLAEAFDQIEGRV